ncbi:hypothetical protein SPBRAN_155 [uncultured Candidatus Thioglobus sp.]|nr:hypothetical protein SPBRAN_155 [uncultured Candidatus Thioglobus sp.]
MARKLKKRVLKDRILLVSEGKETEQNYFKGLCQILRISIEIKDINKTSLGSLLAKVKRIVDNAKREKNPFTQVIFIVDKDDFQHYEQDKNDVKKIDNFHVFFSEPCFEYWLLLHFQPIKKPFNNCQTLKSDKDFIRNFSEYKKNNIDVFPILANKLQDACKNAKNNPHTNLNELVEYLQNIKNR